MSDHEPENIQTAADITITKVHTVYYSMDIYWAQSNPLPRYANGIVLFTKGRIQYRINQQTQTAESGDILLYPKGQIYRGLPLTKQNSFYVIDFETASENEVQRLPLPTLFSAPSFTEDRKRFDLILDTWNSNSQTHCLQTKGQIYSLLSYLLDKCGNNSLSGAGDKILQKTVGYMKQHLSDPSVRIADLCACSASSESQLKRIFKQATGMSPMRYLHRLRIDMAKNLLLYSGSSIQSVSEQCGYASVYYFSRDFKAATGYTPTQYRSFV